MPTENEGLTPQRDNEFPVKENNSEPERSQVNLVDNQNAKWIDNNGNEVEKVFGFNDNAELVNARAAMAGFLMLILTELVFKGEPATKSIFGIG
tara:strand:+ start:141 stop:422 length:282 start_codon:yes stop_codon:yes gene_type:complete